VEKGDARPRIWIAIGVEFLGPDLDQLNLGLLRLESCGNSHFVRGPVNNLTSIWRHARRVILQTKGQE
jgi:hypothetical protein